MKVLITLIGPGGELDRQTIEANGAASTDVSDSIHDAMKAWTLSPGDTIKIVEVDA
jgi:hypothetical protein